MEGKKEWNYKIKLEGKNKTLKNSIKYKENALKKFQICIGLHLKTLVNTKYKFE